MRLVPIVDIIVMSMRCLFFLSKNKGGLKIEQKCNRNYTREERTVLCSHKLLSNSMAPQTPLFSPITREVTGYRTTKSNSTRPLMYPEEILQMDNKECLLLIRGQKPLKAYKIIPDELSSYKELKYTRVSEYVPKWAEFEKELEKQTDKRPGYQYTFETEEAEPEDDNEQTIFTAPKPTPAFGSNAKKEKDEVQEEKTEPKKSYNAMACAGEYDIAEKLSL